jgi:hypothetical protein
MPSKNLQGDIISGLMWGALPIIGIIILLAFFRRHRN